MDYITKVLTQVKEKNADQPEFIQAVEEVLESLKPVIEAHPEYEKQAILEEARKQAEQLKVNAQRDIEDEKKRALEEINKQIADLSVLVASKILEKELDGSTQSEYVDKVIKEVGVK